MGLEQGPGSCSAGPLEEEGYPEECSPRKERPDSVLCVRILYGLEDGRGAEAVRRTRNPEKTAGTVYTGR